MNRSIINMENDTFIAHTPQAFSEFDPSHINYTLACINFYEEKFYKKYLPSIFPNKSSFEL